MDEIGEFYFDFLEVKDCFVIFDFVNVETIIRLIIEELKESGLRVEYVCGFGLDGVSVMIGV